MSFRCGRGVSEHADEDEREIGCFFIYTSTKFYIPGGGVSGLRFMPIHSYTALLYAPSKKRDSSP